MRWVFHAAKVTILAPAPAQRLGQRWPAPAAWLCARGRTLMPPSSRPGHPLARLVEIDWIKPASVHLIAL